MKTRPIEINGGTVTTEVGSVNATELIADQTINGPVIIDEHGIRYDATTPAPEDTPSSEPTTSEKAEPGLDHTADTAATTEQMDEAIDIPRGPMAYPDGTVLVVDGVDKNTGRITGTETSLKGATWPVDFSPEDFRDISKDLVELDASGTAPPHNERREKLHTVYRTADGASVELLEYDDQQDQFRVRVEHPDYRVSYGWIPGDRMDALQSGAQQLDSLVTIESEPTPEEVAEDIGETAVDDTVKPTVKQRLTPEYEAMMRNIAAAQQPGHEPLTDENRAALEAIVEVGRAQAASTEPVIANYDGTAKAFRERRNARANNPETPEQPPAAPEAEDPAKAEENTQPTPPPTPESNPDDEAAKIAATLEQIRREIGVDAEIGQRLSVAVAEYARCKADVDTKPGRIGRKKRENALETAKTAMLAAQAHFAQMLVEAKEKAKLYDTLTDEERQQQRSDDFFDECRLLGRNARRATLSEREQRIKDRGVFGKFMARAGGFLNGGSSTWGQRLRTGGTGAVAGGMKAGLGIALSGVGWPIVAVGMGMLGVGMRSAVGYASRMNMLDQSLAAEKDTLERAYAAPVILNAEAQKEAASNSESTRAKIATAMMGKELDMAQETSQNDLEQATAKGRQNMKRFMTGWAIGAGVTVGAHALHNLVVSHDAVPAPKSPPAPNTSGTPPQAVLDSIANQNGSHGFEFAPGADTISPGEGFYHQFADMGFSPEQAKDLYSNKPLMEELIKQGVAMRSSDPTSPYWIRMPASGHLSSQAMSTIKAAAEAKGFIR